MPTYKSSTPFQLDKVSNGGGTLKMIAYYSGRPFTAKVDQGYLASRGDSTVINYYEMPKATNTAAKITKDIVAKANQALVEQRAALKEKREKVDKQKDFVRESIKDLNPTIDEEKWAIKRFKLGTRMSDIKRIILKEREEWQKREEAFKARVIKNHYSITWATEEMIQAAIDSDDFAYNGVIMSDEFVRTIIEVLIKSDSKANWYYLKWFNLKLNERSHVTTEKLTNREILLAEDLLLYQNTSRIVLGPMSINWNINLDTLITGRIASIDPHSELPLELRYKLMKLSKEFQAQSKG